MYYHLRQGVQSTTTWSSHPAILAKSEFHQVRGRWDITRFNQVLISNGRGAGDKLSSLIALLMFMSISLLPPTIGYSQVPGFQVDSTHNVLFGNSLSGAGSKFMWIPSKGALRAGSVDLLAPTAWDIDSLGLYSVAFGFGNKVKGESAFAAGTRNVLTSRFGMVFGTSNRVSGLFAAGWGALNTVTQQSSTAWGERNGSAGLRSTAWGAENTASGEDATAWGIGNLSTGDNSTTWGSSNTASGNRSTASGQANKVTGLRSMAWGHSNNSTEVNSTVWGFSNVASGSESSAWGAYNKSQSVYETVIGRYADTTDSADKFAWVEEDQLFVIGNGMDNSNRHNAVTVFKNGIVQFSPQDAGQNILIDTVINGSFKEPIIRPSAADWGYLGNENHYFTKTYSNSFFAANVANYQTFSDKRLKNKIKKLENGLSTIESLAPVSYFSSKKSETKTKQDNDIPEYGLIAQEVEEVLPGIIHTHPSGMKSIGYQAIIPFLIKGMQEQQEQITQLKSQLEKLTSIIEKKN